jgi:Protein of unknown function (DUF1552)
MTFITKKAIARRTLLRGIGTAIALPLLDSMFPALSAYQKAAAKPTNRFGAIYVPNGIIMQNWTPMADGAAFEFTPILKPLEPFRDRLLVISGLSSAPRLHADPADTNPNPSARFLVRADPADTHPNASTRFLTDVAPKPVRGMADLHAGVSMDQILAKELGGNTQLASLELGLESSESAGTCADGFSCAYTSTISWRTPTTPLPMEYDPRAVFERMFGDSDSTNPRARRAGMRAQTSILDSVIERTARLEREVGSSDRAKLSEYFEAIRDVERSIQKAEQQSSRQLPSTEHPLGVPAKFEDHANLMYDLIALAYQSDTTRTITFMIGREQSGRTYPELGVPDSHHPLTHQQKDPANVAKLIKINTYHVTQFARLLEKLRSTPEGDGSLLDHVMMIYGAGMSDADKHDPLNLPIVVAGGGCGQLHGGRHVRYPKDTPLANLHLTLLDKLGVHVEAIGNSTGEFDQLSAIG